MMRMKREILASNHIILKVLQPLLYNGQSSEQIAIKVNSPDGNFKPKIPPRIYEALDSINELQAGTHRLIVYPDLVTLRAIYSQYTKIQSEYNNGIVLILPYQETPDTVRLVVSGRNGFDDNSSTNLFEYSGVDISKYEKEGSYDYRRESYEDR